jgi:protein TonB
MNISSSSYGAASRSGKLASAGLVVALHGLVLFALLQLAPVRSALTAMAPIMVSMITPPPKPKPEVLPKPLPAKPRVERPRPIPRPAITTAQSEAPAREVAPPPPPAPLPPMDALPPPPVVAPPAPAPAPVGVAPPAPVVPPRFNADYLNNPPPAYPPMSRRIGEEGKVILRVLVNERGLPDEVQLRTSSGFPRLDTAALETVRQWKFVPARRGDTPVSAWVLVPISFSLRS